MATTVKPTVATPTETYPSATQSFDVLTRLSLEQAIKIAPVLWKYHKPGNPGIRELFYASVDMRENTYARFAWYFSMVESFVSKKETTPNGKWDLWQLK
jgi:hypothetical protein